MEMLINLHCPSIRKPEVDTVVPIQQLNSCAVGGLDWSSVKRNINLVKYKALPVCYIKAIILVYSISGVSGEIGMVAPTKQQHYGYGRVYFLGFLFH